MKRSDRLKEIEAFWKSKPRKQEWESIKWSPFRRRGGASGVRSAHEIQMVLKNDGHVFWAMVLNDLEESQEFDWEWFLLDIFEVWYLLPESCDAPLFINESIPAVCIAAVGPDRWATVFSSQASARLGLDHWEMRQKYPERSASCGNDGQSPITTVEDCDSERELFSVAR